MTVPNPRTMRLQHAPTPVLIAYETVDIQESHLLV